MCGQIVEPLLKDCFVSSIQFGFNLIQPAAPYLATVVLGRSEGFAALLGAAIFVGVALGFALQAPLVRRFGPKRVILLSVGLMAVATARKANQ